MANSRASIMHPGQPGARPSLHGWLVRGGCLVPDPGTAEITTAAEREARDHLSKATKPASRKWPTVARQSCIPASLVRVHRCTDGWYEVGALFRIPALRKSLPQL